MWRGAVASAIRGKRGQQFLRDLVCALDAMPIKRLIEGELETLSGEVCALGSVGKMRGVSLNDLDPYDRESIAARFGIAPALAAEIMHENDDDFRWDYQEETHEQRWVRMRAWAVNQLTTRIEAEAKPNV